MAWEVAIYVICSGNSTNHAISGAPKGWYDLPTKMTSGPKYIHGYRGPREPLKTMITHLNKYFGELQKNGIIKDYDISADEDEE